MVDFRLLGPLEVRHRGEALAAGPGKQRTVLATLLMRANRQVGLEELVRELWDRPPPSAVANLRMYAANLRRLLSRATGDQEMLVRSGSGYRLRVPDCGI